MAIECTDGSCELHSSKFVAEGEEEPLCYEDECKKQQVVLCLYHRIDFDGIMSGYLVGEWATRNGYKCQFIGVNYDEPFEEIFEQCKDRIVVICDFTFTPKQMVSIKDVAKEMIWIDHHKTAIDKMAEFYEENYLCDIPRGLKRVGFSGCELTWVYFNCRDVGFTDDYIEIDGIDFNLIQPHDHEYVNRIPRLVYLIGRYDVWDQSDKLVWSDALNLQYGLKQYALDPTSELWNDFFKYDAKVDTLITQGSYFQSFQYQQNKWYLGEYGYIARFKDQQFWNLTVYAVNTGFKGSQNFNENKDKYDVLVAYIHNGKDNMFTISFYSATGTDVSVIAKHFGGGGHSGAAGCKAKELPIECCII